MKTKDNNKKIDTARVDPSASYVIPWEEWYAMDESSRRLLLCLQRGWDEATPEERAFCEAVERDEQEGRTPTKEEVLEGLALLGISEVEFDGKMDEWRREDALDAEGVALPVGTPWGKA